MPSGVYPRTEEHKRKIGLANSGKNHPSYIDGRTLRKHYCIDCGREVSLYAKRCCRCASIKRWQNPEIREKISKSLSGKNCYLYKDGRTLKKYYCIDCGKEISVGSKRCQSCSNKEIANRPEVKEKTVKSMSIRTKQNWQNGVYDGVFRSPNKPEKKTMKILEDLKIDYIFQFRPDGYSKVYDFYIPSLNLLIEYDGTYWHSRPGAKENDKKKTEWAINNGYNLLRLNKYSLDVLTNVLRGLKV